MIMNPRKLFPPSPPEPELEASHAHAEDYDDRDGYATTFLGDDPDFEVALPLPGSLSDLVPVDRAKTGRPFELCYRKFSVAMSRSRRLCCMTGVNIDGSQPFFHPKRPGWGLDPRIPAEFQVDGKSFYVPTSFDRGHMVRRLDPVWGKEGNALQANADTHHYTNACPQVHSFNDQTWGDLEDWILSQEQSRDSKGSVFTGPIFGTDDPVYHGVRVPVRFFKIIVVIDDAKSQLSATAFVMDQTSVLPPREEAPVPEAPFDPGKFEVNQVTLADLAAETGLDFGRLTQFDALAAHPVPEAAGITGPVRLPLASIRDAVLWAP